MNLIGRIAMHAGFIPPYQFINKCEHFVSRNKFFTLQQTCLVGIHAKFLAYFVWRNIPSRIFFPLVSPYCSQLANLLPSFLLWRKQSLYMHMCERPFLNLRSILTFRAFLPITLVPFFLLILVASQELIVLHN